MNTPANPEGFEAVDSLAIDALVIQQLTDDERKRSVVYIDRRLRAPGEDEVGGQDIEPEYPYLVGFIDQKPGANWMHPCRYLLVDPVSRRVTSIVADRPPVFGVLPATWRVVWRPQKLDDWRLLPIAASPQSEQNKR
jgi:hypothetical protein